MKRSCLYRASWESLIKYVQMEPSVPTEVMQVERKIYSGLAAKAIKLLGTGLLQVEVARALGVTEGQVSQWMAEPDFQAQVSAEIKANFAMQSEVDSNYNATERKLSERLLQQSEYMFDPDKILKALQFVNGAKRKLAPLQQNPQEGGGVTINAPVTLIFPQQVAKEFMLSPNNEVIGVDGQEVLTLPSKNIDMLANDIRLATKTADPKLKLVRKSNGAGQQDPWSNL